MGLLTSKGTAPCTGRPGRDMLQSSGDYDYDDSADYLNDYCGDYDDDDEYGGDANIILLRCSNLFIDR